MIVDWDWIGRNVGMIGGLLLRHIILSIVPVVVGLVLAFPIGYLVSKTGPLSNLLLTLWGVIYAIPSLAVFVVLPGLFGIGILSPLNVVIALSLYALALLVRSVVDGLRSVPDEVRQSSTAVGYGSARRLFVIDLPLAMPVVFAGLRVVTVSTVSLVTVGAIIGVPSLGTLFTQGFNSGFLTPVYVGIALVMILALIFDGLILVLRRGLLPWQRRGAAA